jgi:ABC-type multidrug transport system fused ATPase/permease subunit
MAPAKSPAATEHPSMLTLLRAHWVSMTVSMFLLSVATVLTLLQPLLAGRLVNRAAAGSPVLTLAILLVIMLVGQLLLES